MSGDTLRGIELDDDDDSDGGDPRAAWERLVALSPGLREMFTRPAAPRSPGQADPPLTQDAALNSAGDVGPRPTGPSDLTDPKPTAHTTDGPGPRFQFFYGNRRPIDFRGAPNRYLLMAALWDTGSGRPHAERTVRDVIREVYGEGEEDAENIDENFKSFRYEVNRQLRDGGMPLRVIPDVVD